MRVYGTYAPGRAAADVTNGSRHGAGPATAGAAIRASPATAGAATRASPATAGTATRASPATAGTAVRGVRGRSERVTGMHYSPKKRRKRPDEGVTWATTPPG
jgi:hypothetical protein